MIKAHPSPATGDILSFTIEIDGKTLSDTIAVTSISCSGSQEQHATAEVEIPLSDDPKKSLDSEIINELALGKMLVVYAGYANQHDVIFSGQIKSQTLQVDQATPLALIVNSQSIEKLSENSSTTPEIVLSLTYGENIYSFERVRNADATQLNTGKITFQGSSLAEPNKSVSINNLPFEFAGTAIIHSVLHEINNGNWITTIDVK